MPPCFSDLFRTNSALSGHDAHRDLAEGGHCGAPENLLGARAVYAEEPILGRASARARFRHLASALSPATWAAGSVSNEGRHTAGIQVAHPQFRKCCGPCQLSVLTDAWHVVADLRLSILTVARRPLQSYTRIGRAHFPTQATNAGW